jgi:hypothetical protein
MRFNNSADQNGRADLRCMGEDVERDLALKDGWSFFRQWCITRNSGLVFWTFNMNTQ